MKAVVQNYRSGLVRIAEVPVPRCATNGILVRTAASLVSIGTERSIIELGRKSLLGKARARPDLFKRALEKAKREGYWKTFQESLARLDAPIPLGYSSAGVVVEAGNAAHGFSPGDRVACVGHTFASHAEFAAVPANLACIVPDGVSDEEAAFCMLGAIAMHAVRSGGLGLGATVAVIGLGLLGNLAAQILKAYGCQVIGMDPDPEKTRLCKEMGLADVVTTVDALRDSMTRRTGSLGCDAVIIAAATKSADPVHTAVDLCRQQGRIVVLGVADIHPDRNELWKKEVEIVVSKAGGLGALDPIYEIDGIDLPIGLARWTQGRNVEEFLRLITERHIDVRRLVTHRCPIADAGPFYDRLVAGTLQNVIGVLLTYDGNAIPTRRLMLGTHRPLREDLPRLAVLGAGQFGRSVFLPALDRVGGAALNVLVTSSGVNSEHMARKFGFRECATDQSDVFERADVDAVIVLLPHAGHSRAALSAIAAGKPLLIEKPLCVSPRELDEIEAALSARKDHPVVMVGHNRRYSKHTERICEWLTGREAPLVMTIRVNAGFVPPDHWVNKESEGRSRIVGECTHFIDLAEAIVGSPILTVYAARVRGDDRMVINNDNFCASFTFRDGSVTSLVYTAQGPRTVPRESIEIFSEGKAIQSIDFRTSELYRVRSGRERFNTGSQDYGYMEEISHFLNVVQGRIPMHPDVDSALRTMRCAFAIERSLSIGQTVSV